MVSITFLVFAKWGKWSMEFMSRVESRQGLKESQMPPSSSSVSDGLGGYLVVLSTCAYFKVWEENGLTHTGPLLWGVFQAWCNPNTLGSGLQLVDTFVFFQIWLLPWPSWSVESGFTPPFTQGRYTYSVKGCTPLRSVHLLCKLVACFGK